MWVFLVLRGLVSFLLWVAGPGIVFVVAFYSKRRADGWRDSPVGVLLPIFPLLFFDISNILAKVIAGSDYLNFTYEALKPGELWLVGFAFWFSAFFVTLGVSYYATHDLGEWKWKGFILLVVSILILW